MKKILTLILSLLCIGVLFSQSLEDELVLVNKVYAITNATIIQKPGTQLENATVVIRDGLIEQVGGDVEIPFDAQIIKGDSMFIYAGFIDGLSQAGIKKPSTDDSNNRGSRNNRGTSEPLTNTLSGVTPEVSALDQIDPESKDFDKFRELGFTIAHVVPDGRMVPGTGALISLAGDSKEDMTVIEKAAMFSQFRGSENRVFPSTTIGVMSKFRDVIKNASLAEDHMHNYESNPAGMVRPTYDQATLHMIPVASGELPVFFVTESVLDAYRAMELENDLGIKLVLADLKQGWPIVNKIKQKDIPVFLSLDLPDEVKEEKAKEKEAKKEDNDEEDKDEEQMDKEEDPQTKALEARKKKSVDEYVGQAASFSQAGIPFGFTSYSAKTSDIKKNMQRMIKAGLSEDVALAALTTNPASALGLASTLGTVEAGKIANIVVTTGPYFSEDSGVKYVFVDGNKFEYNPKEKKAKKKGDPNAKPAKIGGEWSYTMNVPQQTVEGTLSFEVDGDDVSGTITNPAMGEGALDLDNMSLSGNNLTFSMNFEMGGQSISIDYDLEFEEDSFSGSATVGEFGTFDVEGDKIP